MIDRRDLLILLGTAAVAPGTLRAQPKPAAGKFWRIGFFYFGSRQSALETGRYEAFLQGLRELGYVEGKNFVVEARFADGTSERLPGLAAELVRSKVDVIVSTSTPMHQALLKAGGAIPVVMTVSPDPLADGLAKSLARPGGNFTGSSNITVELSQKYVELLASSLPKLSRAGVLWNPANTGHLQQLKNIRAAAKPHGTQIFDVSVRTSEEIERGLSNLVRNRVDAVMMLGDGLFVQQARQISELAVKHRLPTLYASPEGPEFGGLMSYGTNIRDRYYHAARFVDRILKGTKPAEIPIEQPTKFELVVNLKTAKALGLTIPQPFLMRADRVIE